MSATATDQMLALVWREFADRLRGFFRARAGEDHADDLVQDTMLRLVRHRDRLGATRSVSGWVWSVARSVLVDHYRRQGRGLPVAADLDQIAADSGDGDVDVTQSLAQCLAPMIDALPPKLGEAVRMVEIEGLSQVRAARQLGISDSGMKSRVQRGRAALRAAIERCCQVEVDVRGAPSAMTPRSDAACGCRASVTENCD